ncbi:radical SAM protein [Kitasatospora sp. NPDC058397]|uniref:radical SAM protein n=1 Tax=unclassified Kitasatospora TaxID=2633591 RepID=UPI003651B430
MRKWNLRFGITSRRNIRCQYCLPEGKQGVIVQPSLEEAIEVLQAGYDTGFRRVHYTGGEPTVRRDSADLLRADRRRQGDRLRAASKAAYVHTLNDSGLATRPPGPGPAEPAPAGGRHRHGTGGAAAVARPRVLGPGNSRIAEPGASAPRPVRATAVARTALAHSVWSARRAGRPTA